jgi:hypothetical protein
MKHKPKLVSYGLSVLTATAALIGSGGPLQAQEKKPNVVRWPTTNGPLPVGENKSSA